MLLEVLNCLLPMSLQRIIIDRFSLSTKEVELINHLNKLNWCWWTVHKILDRALPIAEVGLLKKQITHPDQKRVHQGIVFLVLKPSLPLDSLSSFVQRLSSAPETLSELWAVKCAIGHFTIEKQPAIVFSYMHSYGVFHTQACLLSCVAPCLGWLATVACSGVTLPSRPHWSLDRFRGKCISYMSICAKYLNWPEKHR